MSFSPVSGAERPFSALFKRISQQISCRLPASAALLVLVAALLPPAAARAQVAFNGTQTTLATFSSSTNVVLSPIAVDAGGDAFFVGSDGITNVLYEVPAGGSLQTVNGAFPFFPQTIAVDPTGGNLYFTYYGATTNCSGAGSVFVATVPVSSAAPINLPCSFPLTGNPAFTYSSPFGVAVDPSGNLWITDQGDQEIFEIVAPVSATSVPTRAVALNNSGLVYDIAVNGNGNAYLTFYDFGSSGYELADIATSSLSGSSPATVTATVLVNTLTSVQSGLTIDPSGNIYVGGFAVASLVSGSSLVTVNSYFVNGVEGLATDSHGDLFIDGADTNNNQDLIEQNALGANFGSEPVGSTTAAQTLSFTIASGTTVGSIGVFTQGAAGLDFANAAGSTCAAQAYASSTACTVNVTFSPHTATYSIGAVVFFDGSGNPLVTVPISGTGVGPLVNFLPGIVSTVGSGFDFPFRVAVDSSGDVFVADTDHNEVKEIVAVGGIIPASPTIRTLASGLNAPLGLAVDGSGNVYVADSGNTAVKEIEAVGGAIPASPTIRTLSTDFNNPDGVAVDASGNVFVSDAGGVVKEIAAVGGIIPASPSVITLTAFGSSPQGLAIDSSGDIFVTTFADTGVREIVAVNGSIPAGPTILTLGSGLSGAGGLAVVANGSLIIADLNNNAIKEFVAVGGSVPASPTILTLGSGFSGPGGVAVDGKGNIYVADISNSAVKEIDLADPPSLSFATTNVGSTSSDSPQTVEAENAGNAALTFTALVYPPDFPEAAGDANPCTGTTSLNAGEQCDLPIDFTPLSGGGLSEDVTLTDNALNVTGAQQLIAVSGTGHVIPVATHFSVVAPTSTVAATQFNFTITALDASNNTVTGYNGTVQFSTTDPVFDLNLPLTLTNGTGTSQATLDIRGTQTITATDVSKPTLTGTSGGIQVQGASATSFVLTTPASAVSGAPFNFTVTGYDAFGNQADTYTGTIHFTGTDSSAILPADSTLTDGTGTFSATLETPGNQTITVNDTVASQYTGTSSNILVSTPSYVVTTASDDATGTPSDCPGTSCTLRDALAAANAAGGGSITFSPTVFATAQTIALGSGGTLNVPTNTTVTGPTSGSGASLTNLVTIMGGGSSSNFSVLSVNSSSVGVVIANLTITGGNNTSGTGGGIYNGFQAALTVMNCTISGNAAPTGTGGIFNDYNGTLAVADSTISGNSGGVGGIVNEGGGTVTVTGSTITGNTAANSGGGILNSGTALTVTASTIYGNSSANDSGGIYNNTGTLTLTDSIVSGNTATTNPEIDGTYTDDGGNLVDVSAINLAPLAYYGGPTQTLIPLPGSAAICDISPSSTTGTDQRGLPRTTNYGGTTCQDSGAVQTNYSLTFSTEPLATVAAATNFAAAVTLDESGSPFTGGSVTVPLTLNGSGTLSGGSASTANGVATYSSLQVSATGTGDTLMASLSLTALGAAAQETLSAISSTFNVTLTATTISAANASAPYSAGAQNVLLTATVSSTSGTVNEGTVTFTVLQGATPIGSPVTSSTVTNGAASVNYALPAGTAAGPYTIVAAYSGAVSLAPSSDNAHTLTVDQVATTTVAANASATYSANAQNVILTATVSSTSGAVNEGTVTFTVLQGATPIGSPVTSSTVTNGAASVSYTLPAETAAGAYIIQAAFSGSVSFTASSENTAMLTVGEASQTISFPAPASPVTFGVSPITLSATGGASGNPVVFSIVSGASFATLSGNTLTIIGAGTITIAANQAGNANYAAAAQVTRTIVVDQGAQTISFPAPASPVTYGIAPITLSATGGASGNPVVFSIISGASFATLSGNTLIITGVGTITVAANQAGNANYAAAAEVTRTIVVDQGAQTISFPAPASPVTYGVAPITLSATGGASGNPVTFSIVSGASFATLSGNTLTITGVGTITIAANQAGNANYAAATQVTRTIVVNQAAQTINFPVPPSPVTYGVAPIALVATGGASGNPVVFSIVSGGSFGTLSGNTLTITGAGTITIAANQAGNADYTAAAQVTHIIVVNQAAQTISFPAPASPVTFGVSPITLSATGGASSNPVVFSIISGASFATLSGNTLTVTGAGTITIAANQEGNANYTAATQVTQTIVVNQAVQTINFTAPPSPVTYGIAPITLVASGGASGNPVVFSIVSGSGFATLTGNTLTVTGAGTITIAANQAGNTNYTEAAQVTHTIVVNQALPAVSVISSMNPVLVQNAITFTATVTSAAGTPSGSITFLDGSTPLGTSTLATGVATFTTSSLTVGSHSITAIYSGDPNFLTVTSSALTQIVEDFNFTISSPTVVAFPGGSAVFTFTVTPLNGPTFPAAITLTASGLPTGATYIFSPATLTAGEGATTVTLTVDIPQTQASANPANLHPDLQLASQSGSKNVVHSGTSAGTVSRLAPFALALILLPFAGRLRRTARRLNRIMSVILLLAAGVAAIAGISGCGSTSGFFAQQQQSYTVTVTGTSGALSHSATVTLTVE